MEFTLKVILSFLVAGSYVSGIIWLSEKLGTRIGAALAGAPNTILVSLAFICVTGGAQTAKSATTIVPIMLVAALFYAWVFVLLSRTEKIRRNPLLAILITTLVWLLVAVLLRSILSKTAFTYIVGLGVFGSLLFHFIFRSFTVIKPKKIALPNSIYLIRFLLAGTVVASAVIVARYLGPLWGGAVTSFPATVAPALYFLSKSQGPDFIKGFVKRLPLSVLSTLLFAVILYATLTHINVLASFLLSVAGAVVYAFAVVNIKGRAKG